MPTTDGHPQYPVNLNIAGWPCLVVGGGEVGAEKAAELVRCGALVDVVAPELSPAVEAMSGVTTHRRRYESGEAASYRLCVAATDSPEVNAEVFADAQTAGVLVNAADDPRNCSFTLPARVRRGDLLVTVSTAGRSPALAGWLRRQIEDQLGEEYATLLEIVAVARDDLRASGENVSPAGWQMALDSGMLELIREDRTSEAKERLRACLSSQSD